MTSKQSIESVKAEIKCEGKNTINEELMFLEPIWVSDEKWLNGAINNKRSK